MKFREVSEESQDGFHCQKLTVMSVGVERTGFVLGTLNDFVEYLLLVKVKGVVVFFRLLVPLKVRIINFIFPFTFVIGIFNRLLYY